MSAADFLNPATLGYFGVAFIGFLIFVFVGAAKASTSYRARQDVNTQKMALLAVVVAFAAMGLLSGLNLMPGAIDRLMANAVLTLTGPFGGFSPEMPM